MTLIYHKKQEGGREREREREEGGEGDSEDGVLMPSLKPRSDVRLDNASLVTPADRRNEKRKIHFGWTKTFITAVTSSHPSGKEGTPRRLSPLNSTVRKNAYGKPRERPACDLPKMGRQRESLDATEYSLARSIVKLESVTKG